MTDTPAPSPAPAPAALGAPSPAAPAEGGCACGHVRYRIACAPMIVHCCHCRDCQRQTGSAFVLNALYAAAEVALLSGATEGVAMPTDSGRPHIIHRCPACRVALWSEYGQAGAAIRFLRTGTLDDPARLMPDIHIYTRSKLPWVALPAGVRAVAAFYELPDVWPPESLARARAAMAATGGPGTG